MRTTGTGRAELHLQLKKKRHENSRGTYMQPCICVKEFTILISTDGGLDENREKLSKFEIPARIPAKPCKCGN